MVVLWIKNVVLLLFVNGREADSIQTGFKNSYS